METIPFISDSFIENQTDFTELIQVIRDAFASSEIKVPMRHHHDYQNPLEDKDSTLLLMPAFHPGQDLGVKIVTVSPNNGKYDLPAIQGIYLYLDAQHGNIKAILDAKSLTAKRTAATSALTSSFLSRKDSSKLLMIGTGALAVNLILAHAGVRPITEVYVWGRSFEKAENIGRQLKNKSFKCTAVQTIEEIIGEVDIISCATLSATPLVLGRFLRAGQHLDLVGSYKKDMREADDEVIRKSSVFLDTYEGGLKESGDLVIPLNAGIISPAEIKADLSELCREQKNGRTAEDEITCFKSVGYALEDLAAASYYYQKWMTSENL